MADIANRQCGETKPSSLLLIGGWGHTRFRLALPARGVIIFGSTA